MSDIFNLIRANIERPLRKAELESEKTTKEEEPYFDFSNEHQGTQLDDFIGTEEKVRSKRPKKVPVDLEIFNEEIGGDKENKNTLSDYKPIDFVSLDKMKLKEQTLYLKAEYLDLYDRYAETAFSFADNQKSLGQMSIRFEQMKKEIFQLKEFVRILASVLPEGTEIKRSLQSSAWNIEELQDELFNKFNKTIERAKNVDTLIDSKTEEHTKMNKALERKITQYKADTLRIEQSLEETTSKLQKAQVALQEQQRIIQELMEKQPEPPTQTPSAAPVNPVPPSPPVAEPTTPSNSFSDFNNFQLNGLLSKEEPIKEDVKEEAKVKETQPVPPTPIKKDPTPTPTPTPTYKPSFDISDFDPPVQKEKEEPTSSDEIEEEDDDSGMVLLEVDRYLDSLPETSQFIIKTIGLTGASRNTELRDYLEEGERHEGHFIKAGKFKYPEMSQVTKNLHDGGFLDREVVKLGPRGHQYQVYQLTDLGKSIYKTLTGKKAVTPEMVTIQKQHKSLEHGYLIKDSATIFKSMGYTVYDERKDLRHDLPNGKRKDFDLIFLNENKEKCFVEVERGTHIDEDFFDAMDKILQITPVIYFISPIESKLYDKTKPQFYKWLNERLGGIEKAKNHGITAYFTTYEKLKKGGKIWEVVDLRN